MKYIAAALSLFLLFVGSVIAVLSFPFVVWFHPNRKEYARCIDQMNNAFLFMGEGRESVSSHTWRRFGSDRPWWCIPILDLTDLIAPFHCREANKHEQPVVDFINRSGP